VCKSYLSCGLNNKYDQLNNTDIINIILIKKLTKSKNYGKVGVYVLFESTIIPWYSS